MKRNNLADIALALAKSGARNHALAVAAMIMVIALAMVAALAVVAGYAGPKTGAALTLLAGVGRSMLN